MKVLLIIASIIALTIDLFVTQTILYKALEQERGNKNE